jgi:nucleotide-binding universal stress UspA family protein
MIHRRPLGNVVAATDFSDGGRHAVERAARLPMTRGTTLTLLHVVPPQPASATARAEAAAREALARAVESSRAVVSPGVEVRAALSSGEPFEEIAQRAAAARAELVVVGRHGEHRWPRGILGSTADRLLRTTPIGVLVAAAEAGARYRRPMIAVDCEGTAAAAIELLAHVLTPDVRGALAVHVLDDCSPDVLSATYGRGEVEVARHHVASEKRARTILEQALDALCGSELDCELRCVDGRPAPAIVELARSENADLVVVGTHGRTGLGRLVIGSVAAGVIRDCEVDTLVARGGERGSVDAAA